MSNKEEGWIGVDLDGTLARYYRDSPMDTWDGSIGEPVPLMLERVKRWLSEGKQVRIVTARVAHYFDDHARCVETQRKLIETWLIEYVGQSLPITSEKDFGMIVLYDDRCIRVEIDTGRLIGDEGFNYAQINK